ncbi:ABC transporter ATP-binding protein/permease [Erysipelothrix inopinata]|uniref:ABC transporter ATP-binding protein/permease n=1 Tax=Erysipelothrix inopinata TaxID=225084 RepID=A0A7G9RX38_9FIRM|nr:ABC transporter ATP-binding protein/permease [Erysipelothrix inopinata]QNN60163.1 ABC transporter ATP-binding protein/permease [Erysipelothrix inopinata]
MLQIKNIYKQYKTGDLIQVALNDVSLNFRDNEFVAILGPSGSGKTTLLNIVGGLDRYDHGDLIINGISTKKYHDRDWDSYRNHSVGFVFQSYNLIPHQSILANVELALTISGISKSERRQRATDVLTKVGLGDQLHKKPNQMSGGQMQRVAIARALVNDPDILLADEPTGALDTETSIQVMKLLQEVANDKLVIMVTHNPELADDYANRIVNLRDGVILSDSNPLELDESHAEEAIHQNLGKASMSFVTALTLSFNNLRTKKARTFLTAFAGSIGIIGIALILSLSNGVNQYIDNVQKDTLSSYPISIESESIDLTTMMTTMMDQNNKNDIEHDLSQVYSNNIATNMMTTMTEQKKQNDLAQFLKYLKEEDTGIDKHVTAIQTGYNLDLQIYSSQADDNLKVNPSAMLQQGQSGPNVPGLSGMMSSQVFQEMIDNPELLGAQYDVLAGRFPDQNAHDEVVLVVDKNNEISDMVLYSLGLMDQKEYKEIVNALATDQKAKESEQKSFSYDEILATKFKLVLNTDIYSFDQQANKWVDKHEDLNFMKPVIENAMDIKVVGILRPNPESSAQSLNGTIAYNHTLTEHVINKINDTEIVKEQKENKDTNVFTGLPFDIENYTETLTIEQVRDWTKTLSEQEQMQFAQLTASMSEAQVIDMVSKQMQASQQEIETYDGNLAKLGVVDLDKPSSINLYPKDFKAKDEIESIIKTYNNKQIEQGNENLTLNYTDIAGLMMSSVSVIINMITYVLVGFVAISLIVSSIMIGIITYISVLERTKEIGILRSIGASKRNISSIFNAETLILGFLSGGFGIGITLLLLIPINAIIESLSGVAGIASLPWQAGVILVLISIFLSMLAGLIPSSKAAKQDPVIALRSE